MELDTRKTEGKTELKRQDIDIEVWHAHKLIELPH